jgi:predicted ATPase/DNA-binding XRE family transcriptional regulator
MTTETSFGRWLSARRRLLDLTQDELAQRVGCSIVTIRKLEADERRPSKQIAERLAAALEVAHLDHSAFVAFARLGSRPESAARSSLVAPFLPKHTLPQRTNLIMPLTPLIGRAQDVAAVRNLLIELQVRLLTLIGSPGIGKTRLAIAVAGELQDAFPDGVHIVALAPISDSALVIPTIARALGVTEVGTETVLETVKRFLADRQILLVLDNFEQVGAAAPAVAELLMACPGVQALVTSRIALRVRGERLYPVPPLLLPNLARLPPVADLAGIPTVALFLERAQAVMPGFAISETNAAAIAAICVRLDGLPLAIELAAARIRVFAPEALLTRLNDPLKLLTGGARDLPTRQQTLRATVDWSYHLLDAGEQTLFARLGVFVGGCSLEAAEAICPLDERLPIDVADGIMSLLDKSLVRQVEGADGEPRFTLLEMIREYALDRLAVSGEAERIRRRHAAYYLALARTAEPQLRGMDQVAWMNRIEQELGNLRAAIDWYHALADGAEQELWLLGSLWTFWVIHCHFAEGRTHYEAALAREDGNAALAPARALALLGAGFLAHLSSRAEGAALGEQSLALYQQLGDQWGIALALNLLGNCASSLYQNDPARATTLLEESLKLSRLIGDPWCLGLAYQNLIGVYMWRENDERARLLLEEYVMLNQGMRQPYFMAGAYLHLGTVEFRNGEYAQAQSYFQQSIILCRELGDIQHVGHALHALGNIATAQQDYLSAAHFYAESLVIRRELGERLNIAWLHLDLGYLAFYQDDTDRALMLFMESLSVLWEARDQEGIVHCFVALGVWASAQGQAERAVRLLGAAAALLEAIDVRVQFEYRAVYTRTIATLQAQLSVAAFANAWASGRAMSLEQKIAYALQTTDSLRLDVHAAAPHPDA